MYTALFKSYAYVAIFVSAALFKCYTHTYVCIYTILASLLKYFV